MKRTLSFLVGLALALLALTSAPPRAYAQEPTTLNGDQFITGSNFTLSSNQTLEGNLTVMGGNAAVEDGSRITGSVFVMGGNVRIDGAVEEDIFVMGGNITLGESAVVAGEIASIGGNVERHPDAQVREAEGRERERERPTRPAVAPRPPRNPIVSLIFGIIGTIVKTAVMAGLAMLLALYLPRHLRNTSQTLVGSPLVSTGLGCGAFIALGAALVVLAITLIGLLLWPVVGLVAGAVIIFGWAALGMTLGERLLRRADVRNPRPAASAAIGTAALTLGVSLIGLIPCLDMLVMPILAGLTTGAVLLSRFGTQRYPAPAAASAGAAPGTWEPVIEPLDDDFFRGRPERTPGERPSGLDRLFNDLGDDDDGPEAGGPERPRRPSPGDSDLDDFFGDDDPPKR